MKKLLAALATTTILLLGASAQVLPKEQMKNTAWTGFGAPINGDLMYYGFTDTFQARFDRGKFTVEGMLNWSFLANYNNNGDVDNFVFGTSNLNPLSLKYGTRNHTTLAGDNKVAQNSTNADLTALNSRTGVSYNDQANVSNTIQDS
ncbi:MAG: hypothetical protein IKO39_09605, partial [Treponema sp.]|nr:hypothetical protein [Treponema sp.]